MRSGLVIVGLLVSFAAPCGAQDRAPAAADDTAQLMALLRVTSQRLDTLQARADLEVPTSTGIARIDHAIVSESTLSIDGWALTCDAPVPDLDLARVRIVVDGIETDAAVARPERLDVVAWNAEVGYCAHQGGGFVPPTVGVQATLPLSVWRTDVARLVQVTIRVYDLWGRAVDSPSRSITVPAR